MVCLVNSCRKEWFTLKGKVLYFYSPCSPSQLSAPASAPSFVYVYLAKFTTNPMHTLLLTFLLLLFSHGLISQSSLSDLDSVLHVVAEKQPFNGNVLIAKDGLVVYRGSFGIKDPETKEALQAETIFRLASMSKQFTALGIALLEADGKLSFDDPLARYVPELGFYKGVTVRHLIHHYGGLPEYTSYVAKKGNSKIVYGNAEVIELLAKKKPKPEFAAGAKESYSNTGYLLLATIIERVSGKSYAEFLAERVFTPLAMQNTSVGYPILPPKSKRAVGFVFDEELGQIVNIDKGKDPYGYSMLANIVGDGMIFSTMDDLHAYDRGMVANTLLPAAKATILYQPGKLAKSPTEGYAFGQIIGQDKDFGQVVEHNGGWAGFVNNMERHPDKGNQVIVLSNNESDSDNMTFVARQWLRGETLTVPGWLRPIQLSAEDLEGFPGTYQITSKTAVAIRAKEDELLMKVGKQTEYPLVPFSATGFYLEGTTTTIEFIRDDSGMVDAMIFKQGDRVLKGPRESVTN